MKNHNEYIGGIADVWYSGKRFDIWVEYKFIKKLPPIIDLMNLKKEYCLSALQQAWLRDRHDEGRDVFVILGCREGGVIFVKRNWEMKHSRDKVRVQLRLDVARWIYELTQGLPYEIPAKRGKRVERCV